MKKIILIILTTLLTYTLFAQSKFEVIKKSIEKSNLVSFDTETAEKEQKPLVAFVANESSSDFTRKSKIEISHLEYFKDKKNITYEDVKYAYKNELFRNNSLWDRYVSYKWKEGKNLTYSIMYSQETQLPINGAGIYVFYIFDKDYVYIIRLRDYIDLDEPNKEYDQLNNIFIYKKGQKLDKSKGLEQTQGYYCINEQSVKIFYDKLQKKDSSLPRSAIQLQEARLFIENILDNL